MKHFFKILLIFAGMIALGLIGVFLASFFNDENNNSQTTQAVPINIAK